MNVHFVCTGNVFRSMSAELLLRKYCMDNVIQGISVSSSGTHAKPHVLSYPQTVERLAHYGVDASDHVKTKTSLQVLEKQDIIICMTQEHKRHIEHLGFSAVLLNSIAYGKEEDLLDEHEYGEINGWNYNLQEYIYAIVDYIHAAIPHIYKHIQKK